MARHTFFTTSRRAWIAMLSEIEQAKTSIFIEMYIMVDDMQGNKFIEILKRKAREGVKVKLVLDSFGSFSLSNDAISELRKSGAEVLFFSRFLHRMHRKILIVDENILITGGVNIHRSAEGWEDLSLRVKSRFVVRVALRLFANSYYKVGGQDAALRKFLKGSKSSRNETRFFSFGPHKRLKQLYKEKLFAAKQSIQIVTPYFVPGRWLRAALDTAVLRGVAVEIIVPKISDSWFMDRANYFYISKLKKSFQFVLFPRMNHSKILIVDKAGVLVGSQNLDALSFDYNLESGVFMTEPEAVQSVVQIVEEWKRESEIFRAEAYTPRWYDYILSPIVRLLQPFL